MERGTVDGHLTKPAQEPAVTIERIERDAVMVSGVFKVSVDGAWREQPSPETLEAEIADAIRAVLVKHAKPSAAN